MTTHISRPRSISALVLLLAPLMAGSMIGCAAQPPSDVAASEAPVRTPEQSAPPVDTESVPTASPASLVPKTRENWVVDEDALGTLGSAIFQSPDEDVTALRAQACGEFLTANLLSELGAASPADSSETVELRFESKQRLYLDYISDTRDRDGIEALVVRIGVQSCLTNAIESTGSRIADYQGALDTDEAIPAPTNRIDYVPGAEADKPGGNRFAGVTVSNGAEIVQVWRLHAWNLLLGEWDLAQEQTTDPRMGGWE